MTAKTNSVGECKKHGEYWKDAPDSPCPSYEDESDEKYLSRHGLCECGWSSGTHKKSDCEEKSNGDK